MDSITPRLKKIIKSQTATKPLAASFVAPSSRSAQQSAVKLLTKAMPELAKQAKPFDALAAKHMTQGTAALKKARADAIKSSRGQKAILAKMAADRVKAFEVAAQPAVPVPGTVYQLLNTPFEISSSAGMPLTGSQIVPSNSWAKFNLHVSGGPDPVNTASFKYVWINPSDRYVVVNVHGYIIFRGHAQYGVGGGFFGGNRYIKIVIDGKLELFDWSQQDPVTLPTAPIDQSVNVYTAEENQGSMFDLGAVGGQDIFRGYDLSHELLVVPPRATMGFVMTAAITCKTGDDSGNIDLDFSSGNFQLGSPAVLLSIVS